MKPYPVSIQLYSVREQAKEDFPGVLKKIAGMGYAGVEFAGYHGMSAKDLRKVLDDLGLVASSTHGPLPTAENLAEIVDTDRTLGFTMHISGPGFGRDVAGKDAVLKAAEKLQKAAQLVKAEGLRFGVHNHDYEFDREFDGRTPHEILVENAPDVFFQIDTYWVAVGGKDPVEVIRKLGPRAPILHIKDGPMVRQAAMTAVGEGKMVWAPIVGAADESVLEWLVVELDRCDTDMLEAVEKSVRYLVEQGLGRGR